MLRLQQKVRLLESLLLDVARGKTLSSAFALEEAWQIRMQAGKVVTSQLRVTKGDPGLAVLAIRKFLRERNLGLIQVAGGGPGPAITLTGGAAAVAKALESLRELGVLNR